MGGSPRSRGAAAGLGLAPGGRYLWRASSHDRWRAHVPSGRKVCWWPFVCPRPREDRRSAWRGYAIGHVKVKFGSFRLGAMGSGRGSLMLQGPPRLPRCPQAGQAGPGRAADLADKEGRGRRSRGPPTRDKQRSRVFLTVGNRHRH